MDFNREYRATIFALLFSEKENLLSLYNALNGTNYDDVDGLTINTLKDGGIFMKYRNDVSFVFNSQLTLVEHQSTVNPNMPVRHLFYVSDVLKNMVDRKKLYRDSLVLIPMPHFVVLYNGKENVPVKEILKLSDSFEVSAGSGASEDLISPELELCVTVYNINKAKNSQLLRDCKPLFDYETFIERLADAVNRHTEDAKRTAAAEKVIDQCIREGLLREFLKKNRSEVVRMYFWEYDEELAKAAHQEELDEMREKVEQANKKLDDMAQKYDRDINERDKEIAELKQKLAAYES